MRYEDLRWKLYLIFILSVFVAFFLLLAKISLAFQGYYNHVIYVYTGNIFSKLFKNPYEELCLILNDGTFYVITTHDEHEVRITSHWIYDFLEKKGKKVSDIVIVIHNHFAMPWPSWNNSLNLKALKLLGFKGAFDIYVTSKNKVIVKK